jgi:hypothetical protein
MQRSFVKEEIQEAEEKKKIPHSGIAYLVLCGSVKIQRASNLQAQKGRSLGD